MKIFLVFVACLMVGCTTFRTGSGNNEITLEACNASKCEETFLVGSSGNEWLEQLVLKSELSLLDKDVIKNTVVNGKLPMGVGFSTENPLLVYIPVMEYRKKRTILKLIYTSSENVKLKLVYPPDVSLRPTR